MTTERVEAESDYAKVEFDGSVLTIYSNSPARIVTTILLRNVTSVSLRQPPEKNQDARVGSTFAVTVPGFEAKFRFGLDHAAAFERLHEAVRTAMIELA